MLPVGQETRGRAECGVPTAAKILQAGSFGAIH